MREKNAETEIGDGGGVCEGRGGDFVRKNIHSNISQPRYFFVQIRKAG